MNVKLPRSILNVITTRNEAVLLEEAGTASVAYVSGLFPCELLEASLFYESPCLPPVLRASSVLWNTCTSDSHHWLLPYHSHPILPQLPVFQPLLCPLSHCISHSIRTVCSIEWASRKVVRVGRGHLTRWQHDWGVVLLATSFRFPRALLQYLVLIWFYTVNYVIHSHLN